MDDETITISNTDAITVEPHFDGHLGIKIQDKTFVESPRWLSIAVAGRHDRARAIDDLINALTQLRDVDQL
jgi:hypothetical protein